MRGGGGGGGGDKRKVFLHKTEPNVYVLKCLLYGDLGNQKKNFLDPLYVLFTTDFFTVTSSQDKQTIKIFE